jgi:glyoxylase-like metal-dependent hydrolase (beta-lactamase superfamily II)
MKALWTLLAATSLFSFEYGLKPVKVTEGIYCYFGVAEAMNTTNNGNMVNSCFVDMGSEWLVVDSGPTYLYAKEAHREVNKIKPMKVGHVINTHVHDDHWLGNNYYLEQGATVMGSAYFSDVVIHEPTRMQSRITKEAWEHTVPMLPNRVIEGGEALTIGEEKIEVYMVEETAHTLGDLYIRVPSKNTLLVGDLVFNDRLPSVRDGSLSGWIEALENIEGMEADFIIGGHGSDTSSKAAKITLEYLSDLKSGILDVIDNGGGIAEAVEKVKLERFQDVGMYDSMHKNNVNIAFQMLEWEDE